MSGVDDLPLRVLRLVAAEKALIEEGIITDTVRSRIRIRINQLLAQDPAALTRLLLQQIESPTEPAQKSVEKQAAPRELSAPNKPTLTPEVARKLNETQKKILEKLLADYGERVPVVDLITLVYGQSVDPSVDLTKDNKYARSIAASISAMNKLIMDWGRIESKPGLGYSVSLAAKGGKL